MTEHELRQKAVEAMQSWLGAIPGSAGHADLLNTYNSHKPLARGYAIRADDAYCAAAVSAAWIRAGAAAVAPLEVSVPKMVELARSRGIWTEDDACIPAPGDAVVYDWEDGPDYAASDNTGYPDHVGLAEQVNGGTITVIEGNMGAGHLVGRRSLPVGGRYIRGFIRPDYAALASAEKTVAELAAEVIAGRWGNGADRRRRLTEAGYDYAAVQAEVNRRLGVTPGRTVTYTVVRGDTLSKIAKKYGTTVKKLAADNAIPDPDRIYPGQKLTVRL